MRAEAQRLLDRLADQLDCDAQREVRRVHEPRPETLGGERVDRRRAILHEEALDRRALVEARGEGRDHLQPARLQGCDHAVVMARVVGEHIGAQHDQADCHHAAAGRRRQIVDALADMAGYAGMIEANFRIFDR